MPATTGADGRPDLSPGSHAVNSAAGLRFLLIFVLLAAGIVAAGFIFHRRQENAYALQVNSQLSAIADLKVAELSQWRNERLGDANIWFENATLSGLVRRYLRQPADVDAQRQLQDWFDKYQAHFRYDQVRLLDAQGVSRLASPAGQPPGSSVLAKSVSEALRSGRVTFQDFYRGEDDREIRLALSIPIFDDANGTRPLGVFFLRIDPAQYLYPAILRWPTPSVSGEALLVRLEGQEVLYLNDLRHRPRSALALRIPLANTDTPAVKAVLGQTGLLRGTDYRGAPVIAVAQPVPDSPWHIIVKMDVAEAYAPMRRELWQTVALMGLLVFGAGTGVGLVWRQQRFRFHEAGRVAAQALQDNESRFRTLFETTTDAHLLFADGGWVDCNAAATAVFGCTREQIIGAHPSQFSPPTQPDGRSSDEEMIKKITLAFTAGPQIFEWEHRRMDGTSFPAEVSLVRVDQGNKPHLEAIVRDVTRYRQAEAALRVEKENLDALFKASPVALLVLDHTTNIVKVNAAAVALTGGSELEYLQHRPGHALRCVNSMEGSGGCGYGKGCPLCPVRKGLEALIAGAGSMNGAELSLQLIRNGAPATVYLKVGAELVVLDGARHLVVAMDDITERKQAEATLRASYERHRAILDTAMDGFWRVDAQGRLLEVNQTYARMSGYSVEELLGLRIPDLEAREAATDTGAHMQKVMQQGEDRFETKHRRKDGSVFDVEVSVQFRPGEGGGFVSFMHDISARKQTEEAMREHDRQYRELFESAADALFVIALTTGQIIRANVTAATLYGYDRDELLTRNSSDLTAEPEETSRGIVEAGARPGQVFTIPRRLHRKKDGTVFPVEITARSLFREGQLVLLLSARDISARERTDAELRAAKGHLQATLDAIPDLMFEVGLDGRLYEYHAHRTDLLAAPPEVFLGRLLGDVLPKAAGEVCLESIGQASQAGWSKGGIYSLPLPQGETWFELSVAAKDGNGDGDPRFIMLARDITERKLAEGALRASLEEKEALLKEVHHRVKNNLQVITSLLRLETSRTEEVGARRVLKDMQGRIMSMALLHETLYRTGIFGRVDLSSYLQQLASQLFRAHSLATGRVHLVLDLSPVLVDLDQAIPCGLIINELLSNSLKHAFADGRAGEVKVSLRQDDGGLVRLQMTDTGMGLPADFEARRGKSLGLQLVSDLARQLGGNLVVVPGPGAGFHVIFPQGRSRPTGPLFTAPRAVEEA